MDKPHTHTHTHTPLTHRNSCTQGREQHRLSQTQMALAEGDESITLRINLLDRARLVIMSGRNVCRLIGT